MSDSTHKAGTGETRAGKDVLEKTEGDSLSLSSEMPQFHAADRGDRLPWTLISAVNDDQLLTNCLLDSPDIECATDVILQRGYGSAAAAYNSAIRMARTDLLVFAHQDIYLPAGWIDRVRKIIAQLTASDPDWGVLGVWGETRNAKPAGYLYWTGQGVAGKPFAENVEVATLDEVVLIIRKSSGLQFDDELPGFHMYATDLCRQAISRNMKCYAICAFCIHNSKVYRMLPLDFWKCYLYIRKKWKAQLPVLTPCTLVTFWCWPMIRWNIVQAINLIVGRAAPIVARVQHPSQLFEDLVRSGAVPPLAPAAPVAGTTTHSGGAK